MSVSDLAYDIEQLYIEGHGPKMIAKILDCPLQLVYDWMQSESLDEADEFDPHNTVNS
jgi:hypothetical protein